MRARLPVVVVVALLGAVTAARQEQRPPAQRAQPFRAGANYVRVDMYPTFHDGTPVLDLRADEVEVLEDGTRQTLDAFSHLTGDRSRQVVVFLDTNQLDAGMDATRVPLARLIDRLLGPDDEVAIVTPGTVVSNLAFAPKASAISDLMNADAHAGQDTDDEKERLYRECFGQAPTLAAELIARRREGRTLASLETLVGRLDGTPEARHAVVLVSDGWPLFRPDPTLIQTRDDRSAAPGPGDVFGRPPERPRVQDVNVPSGVSRTECQADLRQLVNVDDSSRMRSLTEQANRANVTFYPVYPGALTSPSPDAPAGARAPRGTAGGRLRTQQDAMHILASETDGVSTDEAKELDAAMARVTEDLSSSYLLGYYSTNTALDGRFREIRVRVTRPGVDVRARRGYRGATPETVLGPVEGGGTSAPPAVAIESRAPFRLRSAVWRQDGEAQAGSSLWLTGELDFALQRELAWSIGANAEISIVSATGAAVAETTIAVPADQAAFTFQLPDASTLVPGDYAVRVRVSPVSPDGLPVTDVARVTVPVAPTPLGDPVLWRRGPSTGPRFAPTADPRFTRNERIRLEVPTHLAGVPAARMLDRAGHPMQVPVVASMRQDESGTFWWITADAGLAPLAPGEYAIEIALGGAKQTTSFRLVP